MDAIVAIINASSDKLGFAGGVIFLLIAVFCKKPVALGNVRLPVIDTIGRVISGLIGTLLVFWAIFVWTAQSNVGVFSVKPHPNSEVLQQEHPKQAQLSTGEGIGVFAYNISSRGSSNIVLFKLDSRARMVLDREISYNSLMNTISPDHIIWQQAATQGVTYPFTHQGRQHTLRVDRVDWYLIGPNYVVVTIE